MYYFCVAENRANFLPSISSCLKFSDRRRFFYIFFAKKIDRKTAVDDDDDDSHITTTYAHKKRGSRREIAQFWHNITPEGEIAIIKYVQRKPRRATNFLCRRLIGRTSSRGAFLAPANKSWELLLFLLRIQSSILEIKKFEEFPRNEPETTCFTGLCTYIRHRWWLQLNVYSKVSL